MLTFKYEFWNSFYLLLDLFPSESSIKCEDPLLLRPILAKFSVILTGKVAGCKKMRTNIKLEYQQTPFLNQLFIWQCNWHKDNPEAPLSSVQQDNLKVILHDWPSFKSGASFGTLRCHFWYKQFCKTEILEGKAQKFGFLIKSQY